MKRYRALYLTCLMAAAVLLSACGGGGGGAGGSGTAPAAAAPAPTPPAGTQPGTSLPAPATPAPGPTAGAALRFSPETVSATVSAGVSMTASVSAYVVRPGDFDTPVFALVEDKAGVILPTARVLAVTSTEYTAVLQTAPSLAPGAYSGSFTVKLCRDAGCASQFPGSPMQLPYRFTVTPHKPDLLAATPATTLDWSVHLGAPPPPPAMVTVSGAALQWTVSSNVAWAKPSQASGSGSGTASIAFDPAGLKEGKHAGSITVASTDGQAVVLPVSLTMLPTPVEAPVGGFLSFRHINGAPVDAQQARFELTSVAPAPWTIASDSAWAMVSPASGTTPAIASVAIDPAHGALASGDHEARLTISSPYGKDFNMLVQLSLTKPTLSASVPTLTLGGQHGRDFPSLPVTFSLNTAGNAWPWTLSGLPAWAGASAAGGTVSAAGATVTISADATRAAVGSTTTMLTAQARVNGDTVTRGVALTINRDQRKILPSIVGVSMVSVPGWSRLSRTVSVSDNYNLGAAWSAASDKAWLDVQRSGATLSLTANPAALPANAISYATVTLTPADPGVAAPEKIRVALWKGSTAPATMATLPGTYRKLVADPIRPLVYVHDGGATIDVYNVYTAQKTASIAAGGDLQEMAVSPDGARLYAFQTTKTGLVVVDLATQAVSALSIPVGGVVPQPLVIRPNGVEILVTGYGNYRLPDGTRLGNLPANGSESRSNYAASQDGKRFYMQEDFNGDAMDAFGLDYAQTGGGSLYAARTGERSRTNVPGHGVDFAVNADGSRVYSTSGSGRCTMYDADLKLLGDLPSERGRPGSVEVDSLDRVYCGSGDVEGSADIWVFRADGSLRTRYEFVPPGNELLARQIAVSGDAMMLVALSNTPAVTIIAVGP